MTRKLTNGRRRSLAQLASPGHYRKRWLVCYLLCLALVAAISAVSFGTGFHDDYVSLFRETRKGLVLIDGMTVRHFDDLVFGGFLGFLPLAVGLVVFGCYLYTCFHQGAQSIYLMRRLPDGGELWRRVVTLPLLGLAVEAVTAALLLLLYYVLYVTITPAGCLPH